jgi:pimeloyl-ACP methyl ester carboxylesterase
VVTFQVDEVSPVTERLPTQPLGDLFPDALVVGGDPALPVLAPSGVHPLLDAVGRAFADHRPHVRSPDAVWLTIAQGVAQHVRLHAEELRPRLVSHAGRKRLAVVLDGSMPRDADSLPNRGGGRATRQPILPPGRRPGRHPGVRDLAGDAARCRPGLRGRHRSSGDRPARPVGLTRRLSDAAPTRLETLLMPNLEQPTNVAALPGGVVEYRLDRRGEAVVLVFHGGHVRAGLALGEDVFTAAGCSVLVPSRPGYGRTPLSTGGTVERYTDVVRELCADLGITRVAAVVGISGGGPTAATMAARHAGLVERLIMISAVSWLPYPDRRSRLGARVVFAPWSEPVSWAVIHALSRVAPGMFLRMMLASLSTRPAGEVVARLRPEDRALLLALFASMRSGHGFLNDLRPTPDITARIVQPTLVIATRTDGGVPFAHAQSLADTIPFAELVESRADSHLVWLGHDWPAIAERIRRFLNA